MRISDSWSRKDEEHEDCNSSPVPHRKGIGRCQSLWKFLEKFQIASLQKTSSMRSKLWPKFSIVQSISKVAEIVFLAAFWHLQYIHYSCIECCWGRELEAWFHLRYGVYDVMPSKPPHVKIVEGAIIFCRCLIASECAAWEIFKVGHEYRYCAVAVHKLL